MIPNAAPSSTHPLESRFALPATDPRLYDLAALLGDALHKSSVARPKDAPKTLGDLVRRVEGWQTDSVEFLRALDAGAYIPLGLFPGSDEHHRRTCPTVE